MALIKLQAPMVNQEFKPIEEGDEEVKGGGHNQARMHTEEDLETPETDQTSPMLKFGEEKKSSDEEFIHEDVEDVNISQRRLTSHSDLDSSVSSRGKQNQGDSDEGDDLNFTNNY